MTRRVASLLVLVIVAAACTHGSRSASHSSSSPSPAKPAWRDCGSGFECTSLYVPLDYSNPTAATIPLALIRKPATQPRARIGSVLLNPGGPGESGIDFLRGFVPLLKHLNSRFDLVSWDTRGVGMSSPVTCLLNGQLDAIFALDTVLDDPQEKQAFIQANEEFAAGCERESGDRLPFMDSASTARDMDRIREAVGDPKLTYLGFSYGTYIGQWYAHLFPTHVRALSLDGVVDSTDTGTDAQLRQIASFESNFQAFASGCRARPSCTLGSSGDLESTLEAALQRLDLTPLKVGNRELTRSLALSGVIAALYSERSWPYLDQALTALSRGDGSTLLAFSDSVHQRSRNGTYSNSVNGGSAATACIDGSPGPTDIAVFDRLGPALSKASPLFGLSVQYGGLLCAFWPVPPAHPNEVLTIDGAPPILLVGATDDPATPYAWAQSVNRQISNSVLLTRKGNGHTSYAASLCIQTIEDSYLTDLTLPGPTTVCLS